MRRLALSWIRPPLRFFHDYEAIENQGGIRHSGRRGVEHLCPLAGAVIENDEARRLESQPQPPIRVTRKIGQRHDPNHARAQRPGAGVLPAARAGIKPLRVVKTVPPGAADLAALATLFEIEQKYRFVRRPRTISPAFIRAQVGRLVG